MFLAPRKVPAGARWIGGTQLPQKLPVATENTPELPPSVARGNRRAARSPPGATNEVVRVPPLHHQRGRGLDSAASSRATPTNARKAGDTCALLGK